jgi:hypothetical protein
MNGMFDTDFLTPLKGYYPFRFFGNLYRMGTFVRPEYAEGQIFATAARGEGKAGVMLTNFSDDDSASSVEICLDLRGVEGKTATLYVLDEQNDATPQQTFTLGEPLTLTVPLFNVFYLEIQ